MSIPLSHTINTQRFILHIPSASDIPDVFAATRYQGFNDGMPWEPPESEAELLMPLQKSIRTWKAGDAYTFTIEDKATAAFLGRISIRKTEEADDWNVGFFTHPKHQGKGVMTEVLGAVLQFGFLKLNAQRIEACYAIWNKGSEKVLRNNGMQFERFIEKGFQKKGVWVAENLMSIRRENFINTKKAK